VLEIKGFKRYERRPSLRPNHAGSERGKDGFAEIFRFANVALAARPVGAASDQEISEILQSLAARDVVSQNVHSVFPAEIIGSRTVGWKQTPVKRALAVLLHHGGLTIGDDFVRHPEQVLSVFIEHIHFSRQAVILVEVMEGDPAPILIFSSRSIRMD